MSSSTPLIVVIAYAIRSVYGINSLYRTQMHAMNRSTMNAIETRDLRMTFSQRWCWRGSTSPFGADRSSPCSAPTGPAKRP